MEALATIIFALENPAQFDVVMRDGELIIVPIADAPVTVGSAMAAE